MRPGLVRSPLGGRPEEDGSQHGIVDGVFPHHGMETDTREESVESRVPAGFKGASGKAVGDVEGEQGAPVGFGGDVPAGRTEPLGCAG